MEQQSMDATAFGRVLGALMAARGIPPEPTQLAELAERSGLEPEGFLARVTEGVASYGEDLNGLAEVLGLSEQEKRLLAHAYVFEVPAAGQPLLILVITDRAGVLIGAPVLFVRRSLLPTARILAMCCMVSTSNPAEGLRVGK
jgi:hypothetical protein